MDSFREEYCQAIARHFFKRRGTPFFLSSKEIDLVCSWERMGIPLRVVIEGIDRSCEVKGGGKTFHTLQYCTPHVLESYRLFKEKRVGRRNKEEEDVSLEDKIRTEITKFLKNLPDRLVVMKELFLKADELLSEETMDETLLEGLDEKIENILLTLASSEEKKSVKRQLKKEFEDLYPAETGRIFKLRLIKSFREKYKIPYVSPFYY